MQTLHQYTAHVSLKEGGEPIRIDYDLMQSVTHGFFFCREDGSGRYLSGAVVEEMSIARNDVTPRGSA